MVKYCNVVILVLLLSVLAVCCGSTSVQKINDKTAINWTDHLYTARGEGVMPSAKEEPNRARAYLKAKGYARMAAVANLLMAVEGTAVSYDASGKDYMANESIRQKIEGYVQHVEVVSESTKQIEGQSIVVVEVRAPMFGDNSPAEAFLGESINETTTASSVNAGKPEVVAVAKKPGDRVKVVTKPDKPAAIKTSAPAKPLGPGRAYTSLIIDATGYALDRCMSPKIRLQDGSEVWGTVEADYDFVEDSGIVAYETSVADAKKNSRCGSNPMIVRAIGRAGGKFHSDAVISDADAKLIVAENSKGKFLDSYRVIFVKDGKL